jgi:predicted RNA binding protein YcfA (HicA-like mRNA interferase family)
MPKLRRLSGSEVIAILQQSGFVVTRIKGSHYRLRMARGERACSTTVPVHDSKPLPAGTLRTYTGKSPSVFPKKNYAHTFPPIERLAVLRCFSGCPPLLLQ